MGGKAQNNEKGVRSRNILKIRLKFSAGPHLNLFT